MPPRSLGPESLFLPMKGGSFPVVGPPPPSLEVPQRQGRQNDHDHDSPDRKPQARSDRRQILLADVQPGQQRQADDAPHRVVGEEPEDDEDVAVDVGRAGRAGGRVVMDARLLDVRPIPPRRGVLLREGQPLGPAHQRLDDPQYDVCGDRLRLLPGLPHCEIRVRVKTT